MPSTTPKGFPFPERTDPDKPRTDIEALAKAIDVLLGAVAMTTAERDVLTTLWAGRWIFNLTTKRVEINRSGTAGDWVELIDTSEPIPIAAGGTGRKIAPALLVNLASTTQASPLTADPRPGVTGTLGVGNGGTGGATPEEARSKLSVHSRAEVGEAETNFVNTFEKALGA